jgi:hypothetical protein
VLELLDAVWLAGKANLVERYRSGLDVIITIEERIRKTSGHVDDAGVPPVEQRSEDWSVA